MAALPAGDWIQLLTLAGLAGGAGQCMRAIVEIKKAHDVSSTAGGAVTDNIDLKQMLISLVIGAVAGVLAAMALDVSVGQITAQQVLTFMAAGYAGADFIEGFMSRYVPQATPPVTAVAATGAAVTVTAVAGDAAAPAQPASAP